MSRAAAYGSRSFYPLHGCEFLLLRQSVGKEYFKLRMNLTLVPASAGPVSCNVHLSQAEHFKQAVIVRKYCFAFCYLAQLPVKIFNFFSPLSIESQYLALSFSPTYIPRTSFLPSIFMPIAMYTAFFTILPSQRTL